MRLITNQRYADNRIQAAAVGKDLLAATVAAGAVATARQEGDAMGRSLLALVIAVSVGGTVGTAAYAVARGADPLVQALATGAAAFVVVVGLYLLTNERG